MFSFVCAGVLGYVLGSLPTAFLLVRWKSRLDIRSAGSGNVGTLNSYQVTGSFPLGAAVLAVDAAKGIAAVALCGLLPGHDFALRAVGGACSILGHNFPVWLGFRGGRGLATAAGVFSVLCWPMVVFWGILWGAGYIIIKDVNVANAAASLVILLTVIAAPDRALELLGAGGGEFRIFAASSLLLVLVKHMGPLRAYIVERRSQSARGRDNDSIGQP